MYGIYGNIYHQYTPFMLAYIPAPWILWVCEFNGVIGPIRPLTSHDLDQNLGR